MISDNGVVDLVSSRIFSRSSGSGSNFTQMLGDVSFDSIKECFPVRDFEWRWCCSVGLGSDFINVSDILVRVEDVALLCFAANALKYDTDPCTPKKTLNPSNSQVKSLPIGLYQITKVFAKNWEKLSRL